MASMLRHYFILAALAAAPALALPASVTIDPTRARPGDALVVSVTGTAEAPRAELAGRPLRFFRIAGGWQAVGALPVELAPGKAAVEVAWPVPLRAEVDVVDPGFPETQLSVDPKFVHPSKAQKRRMKADQQAFEAAYRQPFGAPRFAAPFARPREALETGPFGQKRMFNGEKRSQHYGTDLAGAVGDPVLAANDGVVVLARDCFASGKSLVVWHGAALFSVYFHLDGFDVRKGDRVARGQRIGRVGQTGRVTGPHLHFGVKVGDRYVDPASVYRLRIAPPA